MEAILRKSSYPCFQLVYAETFSLSEAQESVVTDTLPDVDAVVHASGCALIRSKDVSDGRIRLEAAVPARVSCLGEDGGLFNNKDNLHKGTTNTITANSNITSLTCHNSYGAGQTCSHIYALTFKYAQ